MDNVLNNLFAAAGNQEVAASSHSLSGTAQLTNLASGIAQNIIEVINSNVEEYADDIKKSQVDNNAMDKLIDVVNPLNDVDVEFLKEIDEATLDGMLKSQQSKRSRCKSKAMTLDNYKALMTGAIAENLIRIATGKEKNAGIGRRVAGTVEYTAEQLQELEADQEKLRKEIRNIQSKKSIMKSKADFDENDERYQSLLRVEQQLKDMRIGTTAHIVEVDKVRDTLCEMLAEVDLPSLKVAECKELLDSIMTVVFSE